MTSLQSAAQRCYSTSYHFYRCMGYRRHYQHRNPMKEECIWRTCICSHAHTHTQVILSDRCLLLWLINDCVSWKPLPSLNPLKSKKKKKLQKEERKSTKKTVSHSPNSVDPIVIVGNYFNVLIVERGRSRSLLTGSLWKVSVGGLHCSVFWFSCALTNHSLTVAHKSLSHSFSHRKLSSRKHQRVQSPPKTAHDMIRYDACRLHAVCLNQNTLKSGANSSFTDVFTALWPSKVQRFKWENWWSHIFNLLLWINWIKHAEANILIEILLFC